MPARSLRGTGWLLLGAALAILVPATGLHRGAVAALEEIAPLPWVGLLTGLLVFWACAGFYFRSHWIATLGELVRAHGRLQKASERVHEAAQSAGRHAYLVRDNLEEVRPSVVDSQAQLYLDGAVAHADKIVASSQQLAATASTLAAAPTRGTRPPDE